MTHPKTRLRRRIDLVLLLAVLLLMACSVTSIYAATFERSGWTIAVRQGIYFVIGLGMMSFVASRDYTRLPRYVPYLYVANLVLLACVKFLSPEVNGASRWIAVPLRGIDLKFEPSEFAKIVLIVTLSCYVAHIGPRIARLPFLLRTIVHLAPPVVLIMAQPDLGTALVLVAIWAGIVFTAGAKARQLGAMAIAGLALCAFAWHFNLLKDYQKVRVHTFLDPLSDPQGAGYHVRQSLAAIGGGGLHGQRYLQGLQTNNHFIPENHTDFLFTVVGEEGGFIGSCLLLAVYAVVLYRGIAIAANCQDPLGRLIASGVVSLIAFHLLVNIGMTTGIMPVVGVPLPLMSFGGSAVWSNLAGIGLLLGIGNRPRSPARLPLPPLTSASLAD